MWFHLSGPQFPHLQKGSQYRLVGLGERVHGSPASLCEISVPPLVRLACVGGLDLILKLRFPYPQFGNRILDDFLMRPSLISFETVDATSPPRCSPCLLLLHHTTTWHPTDFLLYFWSIHPISRDLGCFVQHLEQPLAIVGAQ